MTESPERKQARLAAARVAHLAIARGERVGDILRSLADDAGRIGDTKLHELFTDADDLTTAFWLRDIARLNPRGRRDEDNHYGVRTAPEARDGKQTML